MAAKKGVAAKVAIGTKKAAASNDVIFATAQEIENLSAVKAFAMVEELANDIEQNNFKLGGALWLIQTKCEAGDEEFLGGTKSFRDLCDSRFGLHWRKAYYLISIYSNLVEKQIPYSTVSGLGWTKISIIAPVITQKNVESWVAKAKKLTCLQLIEAVAKAKTKGSQASEAEGDSTVTTLTFKLKADQKQVVRDALDKCKGETSTEFDSVALTNLATGYLGGSVQIEVEGNGEKAEAETEKKLTKKQMAARIKEYAAVIGLEEALGAVGEAFPKAEIDVTVPE